MVHKFTGDTRNLLISEIHRQQRNRKYQKSADAEFNANPKILLITEFEANISNKVLISVTDCRYLVIGYLISAIEC